MDILFDCYRAICCYVLLNYHKNIFFVRWEVCRKFLFCCPRCLSQVFRSAIFGERPRQAADAHLLLLAGSQHRCSVDRAGALKLCLRCVGFFDWKDWQKKRVQWVLLDTTTLGIFLELNARIGVKYTCSGMFRSVLKTAWKSFNDYSWCLGRSLHWPVLSVKGQKSKLPWNAVKRSWGQPAVKTCDDVHDCQGVSLEDFDGADDGESTTILQASGRGVCCDKKEVQLSQRQTDGVEAGLRQLATDCLRVFRYSFVALNLAESVSLFMLFFGSLWWRDTVV